jgi:hypothetical protein
MQSFVSFLEPFSVLTSFLRWTTVAVVYLAADNVVFSAPKVDEFQANVLGVMLIFLLMAIVVFSCIGFTLQCARLLQRSVHHRRAVGSKEHDEDGNAEIDELNALSGVRGQMGDVPLDSLIAGNQDSGVPRTPGIQVIPSGGSKGGAAVKAILKYKPIGSSMGESVANGRQHLKGNSRKAKMLRRYEALFSAYGLDVMEDWADYINDGGTPAELGYKKQKAKF